MKEKTELASPHERDIGMTTEQMELFISIAQDGVRAGLGCPYEWYVWWLGNSSDSIPYDARSEKIYREVTSAFASFFRMCLPEDSIIESYRYGDKAIIEQFRRF